MADTVVAISAASTVARTISIGMLKVCLEERQLKFEAKTTRKDREESTRRRWYQAPFKLPPAH
uniref:Uncharacterized protein n=1 Tax=Pristionchus pacificus TaxID=54126 RepID=A0A2A6B942_PRIPA|eukprot:PDM62388.1 hypothetical protein PRIPAC_51830 [Pristionchus pacificus]